MGPTRSLILKILAASAALVAAALLLINLAAQTGGGSGGCDSTVMGLRAPLAAPPTGLDAALSELAAGSWLTPGGRALCVGPDPGPAAEAMRRLGFRAAFGAPATACCGLPFEAASFDFALAAALDRARVPARVVLEMERVLRPGRVGVVLRFRPGTRPDGLMKAAAPVASLLRFSDVIGARAVNGSSIVAFKKRSSPGPPSGRGTCDDAVTRMPLPFDEIIGFVQAALVILRGPSGELE